MSNLTQNDDLYAILGCNRGSTQQEIKRAYLTKAKQHHPDHNSNLESTSMFNLITHAYEILGNEFSRSVYDALGERGLKTQKSSFSFTSTTSFTSNGKFETQSTNFYSNNGKSVSQQSSTYTSQFSPPKQFPQMTGKRKQESIQKTFECDLEDMFYGRTKRIKIKRKVLKPDGTQVAEEKVLEFKITSNLAEGSLITFSNEGDQNLDTIPSDIIFKLHFKNHQKFVLQDKDLVMYYNISAQIGNHDLDTVEVVITTIDDRVLKLTLPGNVGEGDSTVIENEGMPTLTAPSGRGNLVIKFY
jgi:DnaJ family protein B protein 13